MAGKIRRPIWKTDSSKFPPFKNNSSPYLEGIRIAEQHQQLPNREAYLASERQT